MNKQHPTLGGETEKQKEEAEVEVLSVEGDGSEGSNLMMNSYKKKNGYKCREISSFKIFQRFVKYEQNQDGSLKCDATAILSKACYQAWLDSRRRLPKKPMEAFRRALTAHCRGVDGRRPFSEEVEKSLLTELRKKKRWACFEDCDESAGLIGVQGFPSRGFHEKQKACRARFQDLLNAAPPQSSLKRKLSSLHSVNSLQGLQGLNPLNPLASLGFPGGEAMRLAQLMQISGLSSANSVENVNMYSPLQQQIPILRQHLNQFGLNQLNQLNQINQIHQLNSKKLRTSNVISPINPSLPMYPCSTVGVPGATTPSLSNLFLPFTMKTPATPQVTFNLQNNNPGASMNNLMYLNALSSALEARK